MLDCVNGKIQLYTNLFYKIVLSLQSVIMKGPFCQTPADVSGHFAAARSRLTVLTLLGVAAVQTEFSVEWNELSVEQRCLY